MTERAITRKDVATYIVLSREMGQCRRCADELMSLNIYKYDTDEWKLVQDCRDMLERKIQELHREKREMNTQFFGKTDLKLGECFFKEDEE